MIYSLEAARTLKRGNVLRGLHDAYHAFVAVFVRAKLAQRSVGEILAAVAQLNAVPRFYQRLRKFIDFLRGEVQHEIRQTLGGFYTYSGELCKLLRRQSKRSRYKFSHILFSSVNYYFTDFLQFYFKICFGYIYAVFGQLMLRG